MKRTLFANKWFEIELVCYSLLFSGDRASPPGVPILKQVNEDIYKITWRSSINFGYRTLVYYLEGKFQPDDHHIKNDSNKYTDWILYYNGTGSF